MRNTLTDTHKILCTAIGVDDGLRAQLGTLAEEIPQMRLIRMLDGFPDAGSLARFVRSNSAPVILLNAANVDRAAQVAAALEAHDPTLQVIAVGPAQDETVPLALLRAGVREYLDLPLHAAAVSEAIERRWQVLDRMPNASHRPVGTFLSFLPAKPGVGASTLAANIGSALAAKHQKKTLLGDLDMSSGTVGFRYRIDPLHSISDAIMRAEELDEDLWASLVMHSDRLDLLPSRLRCGEQINCTRLSSFLEFVRHHYEVAVFDLSGNLEPHTYEVMRDSKTVYVVTSQELDCLHLARSKAEFLARLDLGDRVRLLVNRFHHQNSLSAAQIEDLVRLKVEMVFPNEYKTAEQSLISGTCINGRSPLGRSVEEFAGRLLNKTPEPKKHHFLESFKLPVLDLWGRKGALARE